MISIVLTEEVTEAFRLDIAQEPFFLITTSITEIEAIPATGTKEITIGTEMTIGIEIEAGTKATATEIGTIATTAAELKTGITTETIITAEIQDLRIIETTAVVEIRGLRTVEAMAVVEIRGLRTVEAMAVVEIRGQMMAEATQATGEVVAREAMPLAQHLRETEIVEQKLQVLHQEVVRATRERKYKLRDLQPKALIMVLAEAMIAEEEACQIEVKPTIRVGEEIVFNKRIAASAAIFFNTKAVLFLLKIHGGPFPQESVPLAEF
jgi:hypothetical protein